MLLSILLQVATDIAILGKALAVALTVFAAGFGISKIGASAMEGIARQPEAGGDIRISMIIVAALIEGVALFAIVVAGFIL
ncbi:MAG TPA: ATP synthase F0 subunit C [Bacteroidales bacterium]|jgi:F-type H+-transporting ATPase subunit c|nr:ATP synthase F0 subunit C [Bacteroidales bacterium]HOF93641.1 ATP synthase F0 subunit C [Bacteroidales bacterium]HOQ57833.1 ATP synthase F0 subunit C [Bacteroidales bacterium]HPB35237.1 ATP synthase F0 subunit C [Bacteroidales bacterium]HQN86835.1 ATP synthase F0 subunit C [Bacteroidales bacterium]